MCQHSGPRKQNGPRKRTGCITCKTAHVKCTEERPHCRRCERLKLSCQYEFKLLWEEDAVQRGVVHGRQGVWSKDGKKTVARRKQVESSWEHSCMWLDLIPATGRQDWDFVNFCVGDFVNGIPQALFDEEQEQERLVHTMESLKPGPGKRSPRATALPEGDLNEAPISRDIEEVHLHVGDAFQDEILTFLHEEDINKDPDHHNVEEVDEEFGWTSYDSPPFTHATDILIPPTIPIFALTSIETQLIEYYIHSLAPKCSLSIDLNPYLDVLLPVAYDFAPLRHTLIAASACQLFHFSGERIFEVHSLRHRSKAIRGLNEHLGREKTDWKSLATMAMFCFRDITDGCEPSWITHLKMGLRMLRELRCSTRTDADLRNFCEIYFVAHEVMGRTAWEDAGADVDVYEWERDEGYQEIDAIMGCSRELISLISQISSLAAELQSRTSHHAEYATKAANLLRQLSSLEQITRCQGGNEESMIQIAEIKRLSAMLYFHDRVLSQLPSVILGSSLPFSLIRLQDFIITSLQNLSPSSGASLWPLFVLGKSSLHNSGQARFVLDRLAQLEKSRYLGSVYHARRRVERDITMWSSEGHWEGNVGERWSGTGAVSENERWVSLA